MQARRDADGGSAQAQTQLGAWYLLGMEGLEQDDVTAAALFRQAADLGNVLAQSSLSVCYLEGQGVKQSYVLAVEWGRKAADQGNAAAQFLVGKCHGLGVTGVKNTCLCGRGTWSCAPRRACSPPSRC